MEHRILLVDDEPDILEFIGYNLRKSGYAVETAHDGPKAIEKAGAFRPHLILLDVMMPGMDGYETCRRIREIDDLKSALIAFLSARGEDEAQMNGFSAGADDYIPKPVRIDVLLSRVAALLKRHAENGSRRYGDGFTIDRERHTVVKNGQEIIMPRKEFNLLALLQSSPGRLFSREEIYSAVWGNDVVVGDRTIDVHVRKLREKIGAEHIVTFKGVGYKFEE